MRGDDPALLFPWRRNDLDQMEDTYGEMSDEHAASDKCARKLPSSRAPGRVCDKCSLNMAKWMLCLAPHRPGPRGAAESMGASANGACVTLISEGVRYLSDLLHILDQPESYLAHQIKKISPPRPDQSVRFGWFGQPSSCKIQVGDVYGGASCCILEF